MARRVVDAVTSNRRECGLDPEPCRKFGCLGDEPPQRCFVGPARRIPEQFLQHAELDTRMHARHGRRSADQCPCLVQHERGCVQPAVTDLDASLGEQRSCCQRGVGGTAGERTTRDAREVFTGQAVATARKGDEGRVMAELRCGHAVHVCIRVAERRYAAEQPLVALESVWPDEPVRTHQHDLRHPLPHALERGRMRLRAGVGRSA